MFKKNIFILMSLLSITNMFGQNIKVIDQKTKAIVAYADVFFPELNTATSTNNNGTFTINNVTAEKIKVQISFVGYKTLTSFVNPKKDATLELEPSHIALQGVVVSVPGGRLESENVVAIENRKIKELYTSSPTNLSAAIAEIPGVEQITVGTSVGKPVIRGLSGNRILTYSLGIRVENQQWGGDHGMGVNDTGIESVEVIKGPASLLYGSDALAGIIYFVDARYAKQNTVEGSIETKYFSNNNQLQTNFGVRINKDKISFNVFGGINSATDYALPNGKNVFNSKFEDKSIKISLGYVNKNWLSNLRYSYLENYYGIVAKDSTYSSSKERNIEIPFVNLTNNSLSLENTLFVGESKFNMILGYSNDVRKAVKIDFSTPNINMELETFTYNLKWHSPEITDNLSIIIGSQGMHQTNENSGIGMVIPNSATKDVGVFSLLNYSLGKFNIQGGVRGDYRQINSEEKLMGVNIKFPELNTEYTSINYSLGTVYKNNYIKLRANISSGFRAPNSAELLSNGILGSVNRYIKGNSTLVSEQSNQIDLSFNYTTEHINFSVNPFFNKINNYIFLAPTGEVLAGALVYEYTQKDANLYGGEIGIHIHPHSLHWLHVRSDVSTVFAENNNGEPLPLIPATRFNNTLKIQFKQKDSFTIKSLFIQNIYKLGQSRVGQFETESDSYNLVNLGTTMEVKTKSILFDIDAGVKNLLNTEYIDHLSKLKELDLSSQGINFYIGVKFNMKYNM